MDTGMANDRSVFDLGRAASSVIHQSPQGLAFSENLPQLFQLVGLSAQSANSWGLKKAKPQ